MRKNSSPVGFLVFCFALFAPMTFGVPLLGVSTAQAALNNIVIEGSQRVERETVLSYLQFGPNEVATPAKIDASIKSLFATGLFSDVRIARRGGAIVITVVENPIINIVHFEGNTEVNNKDLEKEVQVHQNQIFTKSRIQGDTRRIIALYQSKGFYNIQVNPQLIRLPGNRVNIAFKIVERAKTEINDIFFVGNKSISGDKLRTEMVTKQKTWWNPFGHNTTYDPDRLEYDKELVRRYYLKNGFADIQIVNAEAQLQSGGDSFRVVITVDEGPRYSVRDVAVNLGTSNLNGAGLKRVVKTGVGDLFNAAKVDSSVDALTLEASKQGFTFAKVLPKITRNANSTVDIVYYITDGPRVYVERIDITGNTRTRDEVIRREINLFEGDALNPTLIERARRRLTGLDYFEKLDFRQSPGSAPDKIVLNVDVREKSTGSLTFSLGYSSVETVVGSVQYSERNLFGMGLQQNLGTSLSFIKQSLNYSLTDPYFLGSNISAGIDLFANNTSNQVSSNYTSTTYGGDLRTGFRLDDNQSLNFTWGLMQRNINGVDASLAAPAVIAQQGNSWKHWIGTGYVYDDLDSPRLPTTGLRAQLQGEVAGLVGDSQYAKVEAKAAYFIPLFDSQVVVSVKGSAGHIQPLGSTSVNIQDRLFKGYDSFRGFAPGGVGPQQLGNNGAWQSIGGQDYAIGSLEANFPLGLPQELGIQGAIFGDVGTVFNAGGLDPLTLGTGACKAPAVCGIDDAAYLRASVGAGIVWQSPFGPLRLDYSIPLAQAPHDVISNFRFTIQTVF